MGGKNLNVDHVYYSCIETYLFTINYMYWFCLQEADTGGHVPLHKIMEDIAYRHDPSGVAVDVIDPAVVSALVRILRKFDVILNISLIITNDIFYNCLMYRRRPSSDIGLKPPMRPPDTSLMRRSEEYIRIPGRSESGASRRDVS